MTRIQPRCLRLLLVFVALAAGLVSCGGESGEDDDDIVTHPANDRQARLQAAETWMYQLAMLDDDTQLQTLAESPYPMLVIEPGHNLRPCTPDFDPEPFGIDARYADSACADVYDTPGILETLRTTPDGEERLLIAYIDVGQAEFYRDYWVEGWATPTAQSAGTPAFILAADPDGWEGNYVVLYWDEDWKDLWLGDDDNTGIIADLAALGFDGVYLDWVEAYDDERVQAAATAADVDAADEMVQFVEEIGVAGREVTPDFLVIAQNATFLLDDASSSARYAAAIDALAVEDTWYYGDGSTEDWDAAEDVLVERVTCEETQCSAPVLAPDNVCFDHQSTASCLMDYPVSGSLHGGLRHGCSDEDLGTSNCWSTENRLEAYGRYQDAGVPVFSVDYCVTDATAADAYANARAAGLRPLVTRVQLSRMTETPPWDFE